MANDFEQAAAAMGINLSNTPPQAMTEENATEESTVEATETSETEEVLGTSETSTQEVVEEAVTKSDEEVEVPVEAETPLEASAPEEEEVITDSEPIEEELSDEQYEQMVFDTVAEMVGVDSLNRESLKDMLNASPPVEAAPLDERIQVIADFVAETGRDPQDWFSYQSMNPSEMDDSAVLIQSMQDKYPDLTSEDALLLLDSKYKVDADVNSEQDVRLGAIQLKMDASTARKELEGIRSKYREPVIAPEPLVESTEEISTPFDASWMTANESVVDDMEAIEFTVGKDKSFNFGLTDAYKSSLKQTNAQAGDHFNQYIDENGNWNHEKLSVHTAILDNIESIVDAAYKQGISNGTSNVVKQAVNPSSVDPTSTSSTTASSSQDKVRQQILNALQGGDDTLRLKF